MSYAGHSRVPPPVNDANLTYLPGSPERRALKARLAEMAADRVEIPLVIGGTEIRTGRIERTVMPHDHGHVLAEWHAADASHVRAAIAAATAARAEWANWPQRDRAAVFLRAAELLTTTWRTTINAATMLGQSKTVFQSEIDAASEMIDFFRFNPYFAQQLHEEQPISSHATWNAVEYRPLEGFVYAVTPFNFTAIGGNLPTAPALLGNTVVWKPAGTAMLSAHYTMRLLQEAGLPDGVINLVYGPGKEIGGAALGSPDLAGVHFTGSTPVFQSMWKTIGANIENYRNYPRIVGETGGKDFIVAHPTASAEEVATAIVRGSFEYQGQKCSAASRVYAPANIWEELKERLVEQVQELKVGDVSDFSNFMGAVIDASSFKTQQEAIEEAKKHAKTKVLVGGGVDDSEGYFVEPTVIETADPNFRLLRDELFGPVVTAYVYPEGKWDDTLELIDKTAPYGLTGAIFSDDRQALLDAQDKLRYAAGNLYVNDKPTGAVVAQQPFGGSRASGTNDKAGSMWNLIRWVTPRTIKETFLPPTDYRYPFMGSDGAEGAI
jgi:1-pyrroline-5-carboxylate dehydrogenase